MKPRKDSATRDADNFKANAPMYGLQASDFGRSFLHTGRTLTVCGLKSGSRLPILAKCAESGRVCRLHERDVQRALGYPVEGLPRHWINREKTFIADAAATPPDRRTPAQTAALAKVLGQ